MGVGPPQFGEKEMVFAADASYYEESMDVHGFPLIALVRRQIMSSAEKNCVKKVTRPVIRYLVGG